MLTGRPLGEQRRLGAVIPLSMVHSHRRPGARHARSQRGQGLRGGVTRLTRRQVVDRVRRVDAARSRAPGAPPRPARPARRIGRPVSWAARATPATVLPRSDCQSKAPSPVITRSAAAARPASPVSLDRHGRAGDPLGTEQEQRRSRAHRRRRRPGRTATAPSVAVAQDRIADSSSSPRRAVGALLCGVAVRGAVGPHQRTADVGRGDERHALDPRAGRGEVDPVDARQCGASRASTSRGYGAERGQHARRRRRSWRSHPRPTTSRRQPRSIAASSELPHAVRRRGRRRPAVRARRGATRTRAADSTYAVRVPLCHQDEQPGRRPGHRAGRAP